MLPLLAMVVLGSGNPSTLALTESNGCYVLVADNQMTTWHNETEVHTLSEGHLSVVVTWTFGRLGEHPDKVSVVPSDGFYVMGEDTLVIEEFSTGEFVICPGLS